MCVVKNSAISACLAMMIGQPGVANPVKVDPGLFSEGTALYEEHCSVCHGDEGDGKGPLASGFSPQPRDLTKSSFKFRSTDVGEYPTEQDIRETLKRGINGSYGQSMPAFDFLNERELSALVEVIRYVSGIDEFGVAVTPPQRPAKVDLAHAETLFDQLRCAGCHGAQGDGQGPLAAEMFDDNDAPIKPSDFRVGQFKGGNDPEEIWMRIYTGLDGTPMPAFGRNTPAEDIWAVTEYVIRFGK